MQEVSSLTYYFFGGVVVAVFSRYLPCSRGQEFEMEWQKKKGPWSWDQNACGKWVMGSCSEGAWSPQDRNGRFCMPRFSRILLELDLRLFMIFLLFFLLLTS